LAGLRLAGDRQPAFGTELLPVVVQSADDEAVLMLAWANAEALEATQRTGDAHFWSRSRDELWRKGDTSGNVLRVESVALDCDGDALLYRVRATGPACHTGRRSCFDGATAAADVGPPDRLSLEELERIIASRAGAPAAESYTARLLAEGPAKPAAKLVEEAGELAVAALAEDTDAVVHEAADVLYHMLVLLRSREVSLDSVFDQLAARRVK
jgi:phosphoribosyl-ATP pyrophosphohydrolase/phosphoribosyl-AMP cyclohydrolase